jgi:hypothetical protein
MATDWGRRIVREIKIWLANVYSQRGQNPIGECDRYNNPDKEARPSRKSNVNLVKIIGEYYFYRTKPEFR